MIQWVKDRLAGHLTKGQIEKAAHGGLLALDQRKLRHVLKDNLKTNCARCHQAFSDRRLELTLEDGRDSTPSQ